MTLYVLDVNVIVAAYRVDHPHHEGVRSWWQDLISGPDRFTAPDTVWLGFARIVTNSRIFTVPASTAEAVEFMTAVMQQPRYTPTPGDAGVMEAWWDLARSSQATGDLLPDAYIAATAMRLGATVVTRDRDFRRFDGLSILDPATPDVSRRG